MDIKCANNAHIKSIMYVPSQSVALPTGEETYVINAYDTAMKLGINTRDVYHSRGMCQEVSGMDEAAINSYTIAYQKDAADTDSMIRVAALSSISFWIRRRRLRAPNLTE